jgi:membrane protein required for colicin V production
MDGLPALSTVDWALLAVLAVSVVVGLVRGLVFECLSLAGWLVAWFAAQWGAPQLAPHVPVGSTGSALNLGVAFALAFMAVLVAWGLLAKLLRMLIHATPLSLPDRCLGGGFGMLRGGVLLLAVATVVALTPAAQSQAWRASRGAGWLEQALHALRPWMPAPAARLLSPSALHSQPPA